MNSQQAMYIDLEQSLLCSLPGWLDSAKANAESGSGQPDIDGSEPFWKAWVKGCETFMVWTGRMAVWHTLKVHF